MLTLNTDPVAEKAFCVIVSSRHARCFAGAFVIGAVIPLAIASPELAEDLRAEIFGVRVTGRRAWLVGCLACGVATGLLGTVTGAMVDNRLRPKR
jgi:hypothetical protein